MATNGLKSSWQTSGVFPCLTCDKVFDTAGGREQHRATNRRCKQLRELAKPRRHRATKERWKAADPNPKEVFEVHRDMNDGEDCECKWCVDYRKSVAPVIIGRSSTAQTSRT